MKARYEPARVLLPEQVIETITGRHALVPTVSAGKSWHRRSQRRHAAPTSVAVITPGKGHTPRARLTSTTCSSRPGLKEVAAVAACQATALTQDVRAGHADYPLAPLERLLPAIRLRGFDLQRYPDREPHREGSALARVARGQRPFSKVTTCL